MRASISLRLPTVRFATPPDLRRAERLAASVQAAASVAGVAPTPEDLIAALGWRVVRRPLDATAGGLQALMGADGAGRFLFTVDERPTPVESAALVRAGLGHVARQATYRWRLAHELGHAFFYSDDTSRRRLPRHESVEEERFCDRFADALLRDRCDTPEGAVGAAVSVLAALSRSS